MKLSLKKSAIALCVSTAFAMVSMSSGAVPYSQKNTVDDEIKSAYDLLNFQEKMSRGSLEDREELISKSLKLKAMTEYAKSVAIRAGIKARIATINEVIESNSRNLDAIYDFDALMIEGKVSPPVISEATNLYNQKNDTQINRASRMFKIEKQARFSSTATNWREYLAFPVEASAFERYAYIAGEMKPKDDIELKAWQDATVEGWNLGLRQADIILEQSLARLNRDYIGQVRFHQFVMQGKLTMPVINHYNLYDRNDGSTMVVDEDMLKISVLPTFKDQEMITSLPQHQLRPDEFVVIEDDAFIHTPKNIGRIFDVKKSIPIAVPPEYEPPYTPTSGKNKVAVVAVVEEVSEQPKVVYNEPVVKSVQSIINDNSKDGIKVSAPIVNDMNKIRTNSEYQVQSKEGIYGSQDKNMTLLIDVKTKQVTK